MLVGHFTLIRNSKKFAELYRECFGFLKKFLSVDYEAFDESDFANLIVSMDGQGRLRLFRKNFQTDDCIIWWSGRSRFLILWSRGNLSDLFTSRSLGYFHFIQSKHRPFFRIDSANDDPLRFYIDTFGIHPLAESRHYFLFVLSWLGTFAMTIPWYLKMALKRILSKEARNWVRKRLFD